MRTKLVKHGTRAASREDCKLGERSLPFAQEVERRKLLQEVQDELAVEPPRGRDAVVEALVQSATRLFAERGVRGASVRDVASAAGVNHALVFRHFGSKAQLVREVMDRLIDELFAEFASVGLDPASIAAVGEGIAEREQIWKLLTRAVLDGEVEVLIERNYPELDAAARVIERALKAGWMSPDVEPRILLAIILAGALGWVLLDPVLATVMKIPGDTPKRRRELARAGFAEMLGILPPGSTQLSEAEARWSAVPEKFPEVDAGAPDSSLAPGASEPPRGKQEVVEALVDAAAELFADRGPAAVSVREVAARAGVNHALVFRHLGSKSELVRSVWRRVMADLAGREVERPDYDGFVGLARSIARDEKVWKLTARAILDGEKRLIDEQQYAFVDAMVWAMARGQDAGMVVKNVHPRLVVGMIVALGFGWLIFEPVLEPALRLQGGEPGAVREKLRQTVASTIGLSGSSDLRPSH